MYNETILRSLDKSGLINGSIADISFNTPSINHLSTRRLFDIAGALLVLLLFGWLYLIIAIAVKLSSHGPVFYSHERIGLNGIPFNIYKFRTMYGDAEKNGPALSSKNDVRVTSVGKVLRKLHLDELPQFYNVLIGDMSIIGTRPERRFYIDKILEKTPEYKKVFKSKPGITSWGQLNYGYAKNTDEMIERLNFDIFYIEHTCLKMDIKILFYTLLLIVLGRENYNLN